MALDEMHNRGDVCKQLLEICLNMYNDEYRPSRNGLKTDCLPCSCDL